MKDSLFLFEEILEVIKSRKAVELNENKNFIFKEYDEFIKLLNLQCSKSYSIYFRSEFHSYIGGKFKYYRIYVINDLLIGNENALNVQSNNMLINNDNLKYIISNSKEKSSSSIDNNSMKYSKISQIRKTNIIKLNKNSKIYIKKNKENNNKETNLVDKKSYYIYNKELSNNSYNEIGFNISNNTSSILTKTSIESSEFIKLKKEIINKNDFLYIKLMKYLYLFFIIINIILIVSDFYLSINSIESMIKFLQENMFFIQLKIYTVGIYSNVLNLKLLKEGMRDNNACPVECYLIHLDMLKFSLKEIYAHKKNISYFYPVFQNIFNQRLNVDLYTFNSSEIDSVKLDFDSFLNLIISEGMKIISNIFSYFNNSSDDNESIIIHANNLIINSLKLYYSNYNGFIGNEKEKNFKIISGSYFLILIISLVLIIIFIYIFSYFIYNIYNIEINFLDRLINFNSKNFDEYLKGLEDFKKKFRNINDEDDKMIEDAQNENDLDEKSDNNSKNRNDKISYKKEYTYEKSVENKKKKRNKMQQQKLKKKSIMSNYFHKSSVLFGLKVSFILIFSTLYFIITIIFNSNMKKRYKQFDSVTDQINRVYFDSFNIFIKLEEIFEILLNKGDKSKLNILQDKEISKPKFENSLIYITNQNKYSKEALKTFDILYNSNACDGIITNSEPEQIFCENIFNSILTKGLEQAISQMSIIIANCINELNTLKGNKTVKNFLAEDNNFSNYGVFMGLFMLKAFIKTQEIFKVFMNDEKIYILNYLERILFNYCIIYIFLLVSMIYFIYEYKNTINSFFNFIGILPTKFIVDDDNLYKSIIKLEKKFY